MKHLILPQGRRLTYYLAAEEFAVSLTEDVLFVWRVPPTVIFGRSQDIYAEVNLGYCRSRGIDVVRRKSGGGCVYSDYGNIMISYVTGRGTVGDVFGEYTSSLVSMLGSLGIGAEVSGRNDIAVGGLKVSGNAFRMLPNRCVVHGTLLYDVDFNAMSEAITPSSSKLFSKGVASVRSRVMNIRGLLEESGRTGGAEGLMDYIADFFCDGSIVPSEDRLREIERIEQTYLDPDFLYGRNSAGALTINGRVAGAGEIRVSLKMKDDRISGVRLNGDYFLLDGIVPETVDNEISDILRGSTLERDDIKSRMDSLDIGKMIHNFTNELFLDVLCGPDVRKGR